jgi:hypothetical protein
MGRGHRLLIGILLPYSSPSQLRGFEGLSVVLALAAKCTAYDTRPSLSGSRASSDNAMPHTWRLGFWHYFATTF